MKKRGLNITILSPRWKIFEMPMTFIFTHYLCNVDLVLSWSIYFLTWRGNSGVQAAFLHDYFSRFSRTLEVSNFVSVDFQTEVSRWSLIRMKFCTRIINKKGVCVCMLGGGEAGKGYKSAMAPENTGTIPKQSFWRSYIWN